MKTLEEILKEVIAERVQNVPKIYLTDFAKGFGTHYDIALKAIELYHSQFSQPYPTPTEAEINEAAEKECEKHGSGVPKYIKNLYLQGWNDCSKWLQNYQTQGRENND